MMKPKLLLILASLLLIGLLLLLGGCGHTQSAKKAPSSPVQNPLKEPKPSPVKKEESNKESTKQPVLSSTSTATNPQFSSTTTSKTNIKKGTTPPKPVSKQPAYVVLNAPMNILGSSKIDILENPEPKSLVIDRISSGTRMQLITVQGTWMKVKTPAGKIGWVSTRFINH